MKKQNNDFVEKLCECGNICMKKSDVCIECYLLISNEMAKTVKKDDCKPLKLTDRTSYIQLTDLINKKENVENDDKCY